MPNEYWLETQEKESHTNQRKPPSEGERDPGPARRGTSTSRGGRGDYATIRRRSEIDLFSLTKIRTAMNKKGRIGLKES